MNLARWLWWLFTDEVFDWVSYLASDRSHRHHLRLPRLLKLVRALQELWWRLRYYSNDSLSPPQH